MSRGGLGLGRWVVGGVEGVGERPWCVCVVALRNWVASGPPGGTGRGGWVEGRGGGKFVHLPRGGKRLTTCYPLINCRIMVIVYKYVHFTSKLT